MFCAAPFQGKQPPLTAEAGGSWADGPGASLSARAPQPSWRLSSAARPSSRLAGGPGVCPGPGPAFRAPRAPPRSSPAPGATRRLPSKYPWVFSSSLLGPAFSTPKPPVPVSEQRGKPWPRLFPIHTPQSYGLQDLCSKNVTRMEFRRLFRPSRREFRPVFSSGRRTGGRTE